MTGRGRAGFATTLGARAVAAAAAMLLAVVLAPRPDAAEASTGPTLQLLRSAATVELELLDGELLGLPLGVWVTSVGGDFRIHARTVRWGGRIRASQHDATGLRMRPLPASALDGWDGLADFFELTFTDADGAIAVRTHLPFCPGGWERQRISPDSPSSTRYPSRACGSSFPFTKGLVWGIEKGWGVAATPGWFDFGGVSTADLSLEEGTYTVTLEVTEEAARMFRVDPARRRVTLTAEVREVEWEEPWEGPGEDVGDAPGALGPRGFFSTAPPARRFAATGTSVPRRSFPDLAALPAWHLHTFPGEDGRDYLSFAATPWNAGPGTFLVEGFRRPDSGTMDAFQYFVGPDGAILGREAIGTMEYHAGGGHDHWHFLQFAAFSLLDTRGAEVLPSLKQGFCIVPTDPVDLLQRGADLQPERGGYSECGGPTAMWVREVLAPGWGDTYIGVSGQDFDITDVPNGTYLVQVEVDPQRVLHQRTRDNDVALRRVTLGGVPGDRTVVATPWNRIDG